MPDHTDFEDEPTGIGALLAECRARLSAHEILAVTASDAAIRHLLAIGLQLHEIEGRIDNPELLAQIEIVIRGADAAISVLQRMVYELQDQSQRDG